jgi:hypothetical protein
LLKAGLREPQSLEEWASVGLGQADLPWLSEKDGVALQRGMSYFLLANQLAKMTRKSHSTTGRAGIRLLGRPLHWRLKHHFFTFPVELWFSMARQWLVVRRSLLTGDPLGRQLREVH